MDAREQTQVLKPKLQALSIAFSNLYVIHLSEKNHCFSALVTCDEMKTCGHKVRTVGDCTFELALLESQP